MNCSSALAVCEDYADIMIGVYGNLDVRRDVERYRDRWGSPWKDHWQDALLVFYLHTCPYR